MILETARLILREMTQEDFPALCKILQDDEVMYAYEGAFSLIEAQVWLDRQIERYRKEGFCLWAVVLKENGEMIGQCGLTTQGMRVAKSWKWAICSGRRAGTTAMPLRRLSPVKNTLLTNLRPRKFIQSSVTAILLPKMWPNGMA